MKTYLTFLFAVISQLVFTQSWEFEASEDPFYGKYVAAYVFGISDNALYDQPMFCINRWRDNEYTNCYFTNIGYICDGITVLLKFNDTPTIYQNAENCKYSNKEEIMYLPESFKSQDGKIISKLEFYELIKKYQTLLVRIEDDCDILNCQFSLSGSTDAINRVLK